MGKGLVLVFRVCRLQTEHPENANDEYHVASESSQSSVTLSSDPRDNPKISVLTPALQREANRAQKCERLQVTRSVVHNWGLARLGMESKEEMC